MTHYLYIHTHTRAPTLTGCLAAQSLERRFRDGERSTKIREREREREMNTKTTIPRQYFEHLGDIAQQQLLKDAVPRAVAGTFFKNRT